MRRGAINWHMCACVRNVFAGDESRCPEREFGAALLFVSARNSDTVIVFVIVIVVRLCSVS